LHNLSSAIANYRYAHWNDLTQSEQSDLEKNQWELFNLSSDLNAKSALLKIKLIEQDLLTLQSATSAMQSVTQQIQDIKRGIRIATRAIALGGAIYMGASTGNVGLIVSSASDLINEINT
jgi:hypothetical protein